MTQSYFIYNNKKFDYDNDLFSNFFPSNNQFDSNYLLTNFDSFTSISNETIEAFINFISNENIQITKSNALYLNYFSYRFDIPKLTQITEEYINNNYNEVINEVLSTNELSYQMEKIISKYLIEIIRDNRLSNLSVSQIYRIIETYLNEHDHLSDENEKDFIDLLFNVMKKHGKDAIVLFKLFDFKDNDYYHQNMIKYNYLLDNSYFQSKILESMSYNISKLQENEIKTKLEIEKIQNDKEKEAFFIEEIRKMKQEFSESNEKLVQELRNEMILQKQEFEEKLNKQQEENKNLKIEFNEKLENERNKYNKIIKSLKKSIYEIDNSQYFNQENNIKAFNDLKGESQLLIISGIKEDNRNEIIQYINELLLFISEENIKSGFMIDQSSYISIETNKNTFKNLQKRDIKKITVLYPAIQMLHKNKSLNSVQFIDILKKFENIYLHLKYPEESFWEINNTLLDIQKTVCSELQMSATVTKTDVNDRAFRNSTNFKFIIFEGKDGISGGQGNGFLEGYEPVEEIKIGPEIKFIGGGAFNSCKNLQKIEIGPLVNRICGGAFANCKKLETIEIPSNNGFVVEQVAFENCEKLSQITFNPYNTSFEYNVFNNCPLLNHFIFPNNVTEIKQFNFVDGLKITKITIPDTVNMICRYAFSSCTYLKEISIPSTVTIIKNNAFEGCQSLEKIVLPKSLTSIQDSTFKNCKSLKQVIMSDSIISIGPNSFEGCSSLTKINISKLVTSIMESSFKNCSSLSSIILPESLTEIKESAFEGCSLLSEIKILNQVISIGKKCFSGCSSMKTIILSNEINSINENCFEKCTSLNSINIPSNVISIKSFAFKDCKRLTQIMIPQTVETIGNNAFENCVLLKKIKLPSSLNTIGKGCFSGCSSLNEINIPELITKIEDFLFKGCSSLPTINLPSLIKSIGNNSFENCTLLNQITIHSSITTIGENAFSGCASIKHLFIPDSVINIGKNAFQRNSSLRLITIPKSVSRDFIGLNKFAKVIINKKDSQAFYEYGLEFYYGRSVPINIKEGVKYIKIGADKGNADAMNLYASYLYDIDKESNEAKTYYKMAADNGKAEAMYKYGYIVSNENINEAKRYLKMSADNDDENGLFYYPFFLSKNKMDEDEVIKYYKLSIAKYRCSGSMNNYANILKAKGFYQEAYDLYTEAIEKGSETSMFNLGNWYLNGGGFITVDRQKAKDLFQESAKKGYEPAKKKLKEMEEEEENMK